MRIAIVTDRYITGGGLTHIRQICQNLTGVKIGVFAKDGSERASLLGLPNVERVITSYSPATIADFQPDVLHIHHLRPLLQLASMNVPKIFTVHGVHLRKYQFMTGPKAKIFYYMRRYLEAILYSKVDKVIALTASDAEMIKHEYNKHDSVIIPNGIDALHIRTLRGQREEVRNSLGLAAGDMAYLVLARFDWQKGHDILVDALELMQQRGWLSPDLRFLLAGDGPLFEQIHRRVEEANLGGSVQFLGRRTDVARLFNAADMMLAPTRWEGLPIAVLEALALGCPVLASDTVGHRDVAAATRSGIELYLNDPEMLALRLRDRLPPPTVDWDEKAFSIEAMTSRLLDLYKETGNLKQSS